MDENTKPIIEQQEDYQATDIFLWTNNMVQIKEELDIELFLFNKNYVVYKTKLSKDLRAQLEPLLIDGILEYVLDGADMGLTVRGFEEAESEENVLQRARVKDVEKAWEVLNWLKTQEHEIETFIEEEHDMKRIKGVLARCSHKSMEKPFYIAKYLPAGLVMKGASGWLMRSGRFVPFDAEGALRIPPDNQLLIIDQDLFVFNQSKLEQLFGYNAKKYSIAQKKMEEISANFDFSFAEGLSLESIVKGKKALVNKLQKINTEAVKQDELLNHAEEMGISLMTDDRGAIIIMDAKDLTKFVNLLNDDYLESPMTGQRYEIKSKKALKTTEDEDLLREVL